MIIHKMNSVSGFIIIIITGALVRISECHIILDILIKSRYTAVQYRGMQPKYCGIPRYKIFRSTQHSRVLLTWPGFLVGDSMGVEMLTSLNLGCIFISCFDLSSIIYSFRW